MNSTLRILAAALFMAGAATVVTAQMAPVFCASARRGSASVVLPEDSGP